MFARQLRFMAGATALALAAMAADAQAETDSPVDGPLSVFQFNGGSENQMPFLLEADETNYDQVNDTVRAAGKVRISRDGRVLTADRLEYRLSEKIVAAVGNVVLTEPTGEVLFADEVELTEGLDQGFAIAPKILLPDGSRVAASGTSRFSKDRVEVYRAVFSPCNLCPDDPQRAPLWQLRAEKITHSETRREIELENATLDFFGVPILWVPYFSQPDPRVEKKTGFLAPAVGSDETLGLFTEIPFFWNIAPNRDLKVTPHIYTESLPIIVGEYRHLFSFGETIVQASGGVVDRTDNNVTTGPSPRGAIKWTGAASINENWRADFQLYRASDDTYLRTFNLDDAGILRSFATAEGFYRDLYVNATAFTVQEQRTNFTDDDTPTALPFITADYAEPLGFGGINLEANLGAHVLFRPDGGDTQHLAASAGLNRQWNVAGHLFNLELDARGDVYQSSDSTSGDGIGVRFIPRATADWSYPLFRPFGDAIVTLTPRVMGTITPGGLNTAELPNEDSQSQEFDSTVLFRPTMADGRDLFDDGQRLDYGLEGMIDLSDVRLTGVVGQSFRTDSSRSFGTGTGLEDDLSDIVFGFGIEAGSSIDGYQRFRFNLEEGSISSAESGLRFDYDPVRAEFQHVYQPFREFDGQTLSETHQVAGSLRFQVTDHWAVLGRHRHDLESGEALRSQIGISYADECISLELVGTRDRTSTSEVGPNDSIIFRIALRHLGSASGKQTLEEE